MRLTHVDLLESGGEAGDYGGEIAAAFGRAERPRNAEITLQELFDNYLRKEAQRLSLAIGEAWVLPSPKDASKPCSRHLVKNWWYRAEEATGFDHVKGLGWHGLRRKFATELKEIPLKDLCKLGGWEGPDTILTSYQSAHRPHAYQAAAGRWPALETSRRSGPPRRWALTDAGLRWPLR